MKEIQAVGEFKGKKYISSNRKRRMEAEKLQAIYQAITEIPEAKACETIEEFIARGGTVTTLNYRKPPTWKQTFNGFSKFARRKGR